VVEFGASWRERGWSQEVIVFVIVPARYAAIAAEITKEKRVGCMNSAGMNKQ
jgi:hypothetical protein